MLRQRNCPLSKMPSTTTKDAEQNCVLPKKVMCRKQKKKKKEHNPNRVQRVSTRLSFKKRLECLKNQTEFLPGAFQKHTYTRELEIASESIKLGNPEHKILFLHILGITPKKDVLMAPYVKLNSLPELLIEKEISPPEPLVQKQISQELPKTCLPNISPSSFSSSSSPSSISDSDTSSIYSQDNDDSKYFDEDSLDLEVMFCPLDFPEVYEEITEKPFPGYTSVVNTPFQTHDTRSSCESGYDSNCSSPREKSKHKQCVKFPVRSNLMRVFGC